MIYMYLLDSLPHATIDLKDTNAPKTALLWPPNFKIFIDRTEICALVTFAQLVWIRSSRYKVFVQLIRWKLKFIDGQHFTYLKQIFALKGTGL
jgi:hypothetical protein